MISGFAFLAKAVLLRTLFSDPGVVVVVIHKTFLGFTFSQKTLKDLTGFFSAEVLKSFKFYRFSHLHRDHAKHWIGNKSICQKADMQ